MEPADYSVHKDGEQWAVQGEGNSRASSKHDTQAEAYDAAKGYSANRGGGDVSVHGRDGKIREKNTIKPARDPRGTKG